MEQEESTIEKSELERKNYREKIIHAIQLGDNNNLLLILEKINQELTGGKSGDFCPGIAYENLKKELGKFINDVKYRDYAEIKLYLGDGGCSRICMDKIDDEIDVRIGEASTNIVKKKWKENLENNND